MAGNPAVCAIKRFCRYGTGGGQIFDEAKQRLVHLGKIGVFSQPVILFCINVGGVVAAPGRAQVRVPDALQIGGNARCTRTAYQ